MKELRVCFIGYGSIAKRHISNLRKLCISNNIILIIEVLRHKKSIVQDENVDRFIYNQLEPNSLYDIIFITNPTSLHYESLKKYNTNAKMFFVEKPVVCYDDINRIKKLRINPNRIYVACPLRYKKVIQYIKDFIDLRKVISVRAICSSYLPDWRPGVNYSKTYSAIKRLGGGVRLDLIHELDYIYYLLGNPKRILQVYGKYSNLKVDTEDLSDYILVYKNKLVELHIDYFGRVSQRKIELYSNNEVIFIDLINNNINYLNSGKIISFEENRDDVQSKELTHFLDIYYKRLNNDNNLHIALNTINLTRGRVS